MLLHDSLLYVEGHFIDSKLRSISQLYTLTSSIEELLVLVVAYLYECPWRSLRMGRAWAIQWKRVGISFGKVFFIVLTIKL
jgi:hypothetical protein